VLAVLLVLTTGCTEPEGYYDCGMDERLDWVLCGPDVIYVTGTPYRFGSCETVFKRVEVYAYADGTVDQTEHTWTESDPMPDQPAGYQWMFSAGLLDCTSCVLTLHGETGCGTVTVNVGELSEANPRHTYDFRWTGDTGQELATWSY